MNSTILMIFLILMCACGCSGLGTYFEDRALDLTDIVDPKYGEALALGATVDVTDYLGTGLGFGYTVYIHEWYGRRLKKKGGGFLLYLLVLGGDGPFDGGSESDGSALILIYRHRKRPPLISQFRVGGEVILLGHVGLYVNLYEIADFLMGFTTLDIAGDDGVPKGAKLVYPKPKPPSYDLDDVLNEENLSKRRGAIIALYEKKDPATVDILITALKDPDPFIRWTATWTLRDIGDMSACGALIEALDDEDDEVRFGALEALQQISGEDFGEDSSGWKNWWNSKW